MKSTLTLLLIIATLLTFGQGNQGVNLRWKIGKNEKLSYATVMSDIDTSSIEMDFGVLFKSLSDNSKNGLKESKDLFRQLNQALKSLDFVTTLTNKGDGIIDIVMTTKPKDNIEGKKYTTGNKEKDILKMMQSMNQGIVLRGSVYENGGVHSFWVKGAQKNLISLFFELPAKEVKIGDKWSLDINLISNDQNFKCDTASKINEVTLTDIKNINGETIAVLKYNIVEYVKGNFTLPSLNANEGEQKETMMKFTDQGYAEFSVDKGRWVSYDGIMSLVASGVMTANKKTKFTLIDEKNISR
jgi:hypothetical protein